MAKKTLAEEAVRRAVGESIPPKKRRIDLGEESDTKAPIPDPQGALPLRWSPPSQWVDPLSAFRDHMPRLERVKQKLAERSASVEKAITSEAMQDEGIFIFLSSFFFLQKLFQTFMCPLNMH